MILERVVVVSARSKGITQASAITLPTEGANTPRVGMSKTRGEGRPGAEKSQRLVVTPEAAKSKRDRAKQEEADWASRSGPVTVRKKDHDGNSS